MRYRVCYSSDERLVAGKHQSASHLYALSVALDENKGRLMGTGWMARVLDTETGMLCAEDWSSIPQHRAQRLGTEVVIAEAIRDYQPVMIEALRDTTLECPMDTVWVLADPFDKVGGIAAMMLGHTSNPTALERMYAGATTWPLVVGVLDCSGFRARAGSVVFVGLGTTTVVTTSELSELHARVVAEKLAAEGSTVDLSAMMRAEQGKAAKPKLKLTPRGKSRKARRR